MPIKLNWTKGKNVGLAMIFLGIMGLLQVIFILIAQYAMEVGALYVTVIIPIGVIAATTYAVIMLLESSTSMSNYRSARKFMQKRDSKKTSKGQIQIGNFSFNSLYIRPVLLVVIAFSACFGISYAILFKLIDDMPTLFVICENVGAIGSLIFATFIETSTKRKTR